MFRVRDARTRETLPGFPSPYLIGLAGTNEAYNGKPTGFWRARDDAYDAVHAPGVVYTKVRVEHVDDWKVELEIEIVDPSVVDEEAMPPYADWFVVEAADRREAEDLAMAAARKNIEEQYGDVGSRITITRAREGVSI